MRSNARTGKARRSCSRSARRSRPPKPSRISPAPWARRAAAIPPARVLRRGESGARLGTVEEGGRVLQAARAADARRRRRSRRDRRAEAVPRQREVSDRLRRAALALLLSGALAALADPGDDEGSGDPEYARGRQAIEAKDWQGAVRLLSSAALRDTRNADIQNYLGYAYRHLREMPLAFKHYSRALQVDPRHRGAHEYLGEADP